MPEFDPSARYVAAALRKPCAEAIAQGWTARKSPPGWMLRSPKRTQKFYVPASTGNPEGVARRLRELITKAFLVEDNGFRPNAPEGMAEEILENLQEMEGATIRPGGVPTIGCDDCDREFTTWDGFAAHQKVCLANVAAEMAAEYEPEADPEPEEVLGPPEGPEMHEEEALSSVEFVPNSTKMVNREEAVADVETPKKKRGGYTWVHVRDELHRALYSAVRDTTRRKGETDSKWSKRLAEYIESNDLMPSLTDSESSSSDTETLNAIRELLGGGEVDNLKEQLEEKTQEADKLRDTLRTLASFAKEEV